MRRIYSFDNSDYMMLDSATKRNLELTSSMQDGSSEGTLISILDDTCTSMGARMLRKWMMRPLKNPEPIQKRLDAVEELHNDHNVRSDLRRVLDSIGDLERLISRVSIGRAGPRDLIQLRDSLKQMDSVSDLIEGSQTLMLSSLTEQLDSLPEVTGDIFRTLFDEPPASLKDGGVIRDGVHAELDELRDITKNAKQYIARIQKELSVKTGINSLKLGYNKVFGYYIEITNAHKERIPDDFIRKQTLVNAERYITPELKEIEEKILSAEERIVVLEHEIYNDLVIRISEYADAIYRNALAIAQLDVLQSFAETAFRHSYVKPGIHNGSQLSIRAGRHPVVERLLPMGEPFIPNDIELDCDKNQIMIITGPNMAGKSVILRQTGLIVLLAQIGCFVPAKEASIGIVDKIFTRVGASDNLAAGESTFLVEMNEAANILNNATTRSLILLDEVGRGTSTFDGLSIAWSLAEYLHNNPSVAAKTLFATHYHELNELEQIYDRIINFNVQVREHNGKVIFLRKLVKGGADHSYGIQVASMAGLPEVIVQRAREILKNLESHSLDLLNNNGTKSQLTGPNDNRSAIPDDTGMSGQHPVENGTNNSNTSSGSVQPDTMGSSGRGNLPRLSDTKSAFKDVQPQKEIPQLSLFSGLPDPVWDTIRTKLEGVDVNRLTPIEALLLLSELKRMLDD